MAHYLQRDPLSPENLYRYIPNNNQQKLKKEATQTNPFLKGIPHKPQTISHNSNLESTYDGSLDKSTSSFIVSQRTAGQLISSLSQKFHFGQNQLNPQCILTDSLSQGYQDQGKSDLSFVCKKKIKGLAKSRDSRSQPVSQYSISVLQKQVKLVKDINNNSQKQNDTLHSNENSCTKMKRNQSLEKNNILCNMINQQEKKSPKLLRKSSELKQSSCSLSTIKKPLNNQIAILSQNQHFLNATCQNIHQPPEKPKNIPNLKISRDENNFLQSLDSKSTKFDSPNARKCSFVLNEEKETSRALECSKKQISTTQLKQCKKLHELIFHIQSPHSLQSPSNQTDEYKYPQRKSSSTHKYAKFKSPSPPSKMKCENKRSLIQDVNKSLNYVPFILDPSSSHKIPHNNSASIKNLTPLKSITNYLPIQQLTTENKNMFSNQFSLSPFDEITLNSNLITKQRESPSFKIFNYEMQSQISSLETNMISAIYQENSEVFDNHQSNNLKNEEHFSKQNPCPQYFVPNKQPNQSNKRSVSPFILSYNKNQVCDKALSVKKNPLNTELPCILFSETKGSHNNAQKYSFC